LLVKQVLRNGDGLGNPKWGQIVSNTRGVVFIATPHLGSHLAAYLRALRHVFRLTPMTTELEANAAALRELNIWYRENVDRLNIHTEIFYETRETHGVRVVDESSSDPGIKGTIPIPVDADHLTICKPANQEDLVYKKVLSFVLDCLSAQGSQESKLSSPATLQPTNFGDHISLNEIVNTLDDYFSFRWELSSFDFEQGRSRVYWPVRLRHPTPIHATQCFAASALQQRGAEIYLFIDDLGEQDFPVDSFIQKFQHWFGLNGGALSQANIKKFSEVIPPLDNGSRETAHPWPTVRKWLGDTEYRMELVLRLAKLIPISGPATFDDLALKRPRRLLTPALVWSCLDYLHNNAPDR
jgi:hypothetical protein